MNCPFCLEEDFDGPGLADHLLGRNCEKAEIEYGEFRKEERERWERIREVRE
jgi:hypothetical protein